MTAYTAILNTAIDVDSPVTTGLVGNLRDNPIAITEGSAGAPKVQTAAVQDLAITTAKLADGSVTSDKLSGSVQSAKVWARLIGASTIVDSFNVTSVSSAGTSITVNFTTAMANANYAVVITSLNNESVLSIATTTTSLTFNTGGVNTAGKEYSVVVFGD